MDFRRSNDDSPQRWAPAERALEAKKKEMAELLQAAQTVAPPSLSASGQMSPISFREAAQPYEGDDQQRTVELEGELRQRSAALENMLNEKRNIERLAVKQQAGLLDLSKELAIANEKISKLSLEVQTKHEQQKAHLLRQRARLMRSEQKTMIVDRVRQEMLAAPAATSAVVSPQITAKTGSVGRESTLAELYYMVMQLENQLRDSQRVAGELRGENKDLRRLLRVRDDEFSKLKTAAATASVDLSDKMEYVRKITDLENQRRLDSEEVAAVRAENELLGRIQQAKTAAIVHLTQEVNAREIPADVFKEHKQELQVLREEASAAKSELERARRTIKQQSDTIEKQIEELRDKGVPFKLWNNERLLLQAEIRSLHDERDVQDSNINRQKQRIQQLQEKLVTLKKFISAHPQSTESPRRTLSSSGAGPAVEGDAPEPEVPYEVFANLERQYKRLGEQLAAAQTQLLEKDDVIEMLEKKTKVLSKATSNESKAARQRAIELEDENAVLRQKVEFMIGEKSQLLSELYMLKLGKTIR